MERVEDFGIIPVDFATVANTLKQYKSSKDKISRLEKSGTLIRIKKGLFVLSPKISAKPLSKELIANHLLGPSYVSLESALYYYGLLPERVYTTRSVTIKRSKRFDTGLGVFEYLSVPDSYYSIGVKSEVIEGSYAFLIASPEKALCDLLLTSSNLRIQSKKAMIAYLTESLRVDFSSWNSWDIQIVKNCIETGRKKNRLQLLYKVLKNE